MMKISLHFLVLVLFRIGLCDDNETESGEERILGGGEAKIGMFPYVLSLQAQNQMAYCAGTLIEPSWGVTSANCLDSLKGQRIKVVAGMVNMKSEEGQTRYVAESYNHYKYLPGKLAGYDLAVFKVDRPFQLDDKNINVIEIRDMEWPQHGFGNLVVADGVTMGWGFRGDGGYGVLHYYRLKVYHGETACSCMRKMEEKLMICNDELPDSAGPCVGDTGGPLVYNGKLVGVIHTNFFVDDCYKFYPIVPWKACVPGPNSVIAFTYICPELKWIGYYVPGVPEYPESCSGSYIFLSFRLYLISIVLLISINMLNR